MDSRSAGDTLRSVKRSRQRTADSKYDFVKVKVFIEEAPSSPLLVHSPSPSPLASGSTVNAPQSSSSSNNNNKNGDESILASQKHMYVLSRYVLARNLQFAAVPSEDASKLAKTLKRTLVDAGMFTVSQLQLEARLFGLMSDKGYGEEFIRRYKAITQLFSKKTPLLILIGGAPLTVSTDLPNQLSNLLNIPNIQETDIVSIVLMSVHPTILPAEPISERFHQMDLSTHSGIRDLKEECQVIWNGLNGDFKKCFSDGKALIVVGSHLDPALFSELSAFFNNDPAQPKPVIVPIILAPPCETHRVRFHRHLSRLLCIDGNETQSAVDQVLVDRAVANAMYWQDYLVGYESSEIRVIRQLHSAAEQIHQIVLERTPYLDR